MEINYTVYEKIYIYYLRGGGISISTNTEIDYLLKDITNDEIQILERWRYNIQYITQYSLNIDVEDMLETMERVSNHKFPIDISMVKDNQLNIVASYYMMLGWDLSTIQFPQPEYIGKLLKYEYAFLISEFRDHKIDSKTNIKDMKVILGNLSRKEKQELTKFRQLVSTIYDYYPEYSVESLVKHFGIMHKQSFPMPSGFTNKNEVVMAYYTYKGFDVLKKKKVFTEEQEYLLHPNLKGIIIVNAGPGTGKTTVANERAFRLKHEGVLLVSFTNDAIDENHKRLKMYPNMRTLLQKKKYEKNTNVINVTTLDSLAHHIVKAHKQHDSYDQNVVTATNLCNRLGNSVKKYKQIIVDESQDIDDNKGKLILQYSILSGAKCIVIFGDPRQRIHDKYGGWYSKLWVDGHYNNIPVTRIGFSYSYRFHNPLHLDIANMLSKQRPQLHHQLVQYPNIRQEDSKEITLYTAEYNDVDVDIGRVADYILNELHLKRNVPFSEIAITGPSMNKNNATSAMAGKICSVFKDRGIPCYAKIDGTFVPNAVLFSTIHSIKGKEFDYVFIFGSNSFPESFKNIPYESAESLIYVMHTRARKRMYYMSLNHDMYTPVRGLRLEPNPYINNRQKITNKTFITEDVGAIIYKISELSTEFSFNKLAESNDMTLVLNKVDPIKTKISFDGHILPPRPDSINKRFWGIYCSMCVQLFMTNKYHTVFTDLVSTKIKINNAKQIKVLANGKYEAQNRNGYIVNGRELKTGRLILRKGTINDITDEEFTELTIILDKQIIDVSAKEMLFLAKIYDYIVSGNTQSRYDIESDTIDKYENNLTEIMADMEIEEDIMDEMITKGIMRTLFKDIALSIESEYGVVSEVEKLVNSTYMNICGSIDAQTEMYTLEFKTSNREISLEDAYQAQLYSLCTGTEPFVINLQTGNVAYITSSQSVERWRYLVKSYSNLRTHVDIVIDRKNKLIEKRHGNKNMNRPINRNMFVIDTEFDTLFKNRVIFDIALVNMIDPYRSLIMTINPGQRSMKFATDWIHESKELFNTSLNIFEFKRLFVRLCSILGIKEVELIYYNCKTDIEWCDNSINDINKKYTDLMPDIAKDIKKYGYIDSRPKLTDYYETKCTPIEYQPHLKAHTALSDTLFLYELLQLDAIPP